MRLENIKTNRGFSTLDALAVVGALLALFVVSAAIVNRQMDVRNIELAKNETQFMSERLWSLELDGSRQDQSPGRAIASTNPNALQEEMTKYAQRKDPWGSKYQVQMIKNGYGQTTALAVWSMGPDEKNDTDEAELRTSVLAGDAKFGGDDVGSIFSRR